MIQFPSEPPEWLDKWPQHSQIIKEFPNGVKIFYNRNRLKMKINAVRWIENGVTASIDRYKCSWQLRNNNWIRTCNCGMKSGLCSHNFALAGIITDKYLSKAAPEPSKARPSALKQSKPFQKSLLNPQPSSYLKNNNGNRNLPPKKLTVEADLKTSPGFALIRFYDNLNNRRRLLKISELYNFVIMVSSRPEYSVWQQEDTDFFQWFKPRLDRKKLGHYAKISALKIDRELFEKWLCHWRELQPGRFIERHSQQAITGGDNTVKLRVELAEEGERTRLSAVALFPDGEKAFFHELAREIKRQLQATGEQSIDYQREYLLKGKICRIDYPFTPKTVWELFSAKNPSMGTEHVCRHLPILLEGRLDLVGGPVVDLKKVKAKLKLTAQTAGDALILQPQLNNQYFESSTQISRSNDRFILSSLENKHIDELKRFFQNCGAVEQKQRFIIKLHQDKLQAIVDSWDKISKRVSVKADAATKALLNPTKLIPSIEAKSTGQWVDLFTSWNHGENTVFTESINFAVKNKSSFLRSREGNWIRLDMTALTTAFAELEKSGLGFGFQRHVASEAVKLLEDDQMESHLGDSARQTLIQIKKSLREDYQLAPSFAERLRHYQLEGFRFLKQMDQYQIGCILADDMGLGKTIQTLALLQSTAHLHSSPSLVCAPASVINVWLHEAKKFAPDLRVAIAHGTAAKRHKIIKNHLNYDLIITTYGSMRNDVKKLIEIEFDFLLLDEAQYIRNPNTKIYSAVTLLQARQKIAITGTPVENSATDLWSIVNFLNPGFLGLLDQFKAAYDNDNSKTARKHLAARIAPLLLRRRKELVAKELPPKTIESIIVEMPQKQRDLYRQYLGQLTDLYSADEKNSIKLLAILTRLRQICCSPQLIDQEGESGKLERMLEMIQEIIAEGHSVLVFSSFTSMLQIIEDRIAETPTIQKKITGATPVNKRQQLVQEFNESDTPELFLLSLKAAGTGLTLTKADYVFIYDPWWNPAAENQAIDRTHRIGQDKPVIAYKMVAQGTIEEEILKLQEQKQELFNDIIGDSAAVPESISSELLAAIMEQQSL